MGYVAKMLVITLCAVTVAADPIRVDDEIIVLPNSSKLANRGMSAMSMKTKLDSLARKFFNPDGPFPYYYEIPSKAVGKVIRNPQSNDPVFPAVHQSGYPSGFFARFNARQGVDGDI